MAAELQLAAVVDASGDKFAVETTAVAERRRWARLPIPVPLFLRGTDEGGAQFLEFSTALNFSAGGVLLAARRRVPRLVDISVEIPSAPAPTLLPPHPARVFKAKLVRDLIAGEAHLLALKFTRPLQ